MIRKSITLRMGLRSRCSAFHVRVCQRPPFGLPKRPQNDTKKGPNTKTKKHRFCYYLLYLRHIEGSKKSSFLVLFGDPFSDTFSRPLFHRFWTLLGTLLGPFGHQKSTLKNTPKKDTKKELFYKPVLAREREARLNARASSQACFK